MDFNTMGGGLGIQEEGIHPSSGLRCFTQTGVLDDASDCIVGDITPLANASDWTTIPQSGTRLPFPCTPCATFVQTNGTPANTQVFGLRLTGVDYFGNAVSETIDGMTTTPSSTIGVPSAPYERKTRLWFSKVFAYVTKVEYKLSGTQAGADFIMLGAFWDFDYSGASAPYENYINQANQGIGTPLRINPFGPSIPTTLAELVAVELILLSPQVFPLNSGAEAAATAYHLLPSDAAMAVTNVSAANPAVVTVNPGHGFPAGSQFRVRLIGSEKTYLRGEFLATYASATTFTIPVNVVGTHTSYTNFIAYFPGAVVSFDRREPVLIGSIASPTPAGINGYHNSIWTNPYQFTIPVDSTGGGSAGTDGTGYVHVLKPARAVLGPYNSALTGSSRRGGFRMGTNASGYRGTPYKWNVYKEISSSNGSENPFGASIYTSERTIGDMAGTLVDVHPILNWSPRDRVQFIAHFRTQLGTVRATAGSTYPR